MKRINPNQLSIFDIVLDHSEPPPAPSEVIAKPLEQTSLPPTSNGNRCPYKIPTVDEIMKFIDHSYYTVDKRKLLSDVSACGALAISNLVDLTQYDEREEQYKQIINSYKPKERELIVEIFSKIFALLSSVVYDNGSFGDYLGEIFMCNNMGTSKKGQFFTPYHIAEMMARMAIGEKANDEIKDDKILTISDPCCGSGVMSLGALDVLKKHGINYTRNCFFDCSDIDLRCVHMTYLQLALAGVPAIIKHQNTLTLETWSVWKTPAFIFQYHRFYKYDINLPKEKTA